MLHKYSALVLEILIFYSKLLTLNLKNFFSSDNSSRDDTLSKVIN